MEKKAIQIAEYVKATLEPGSEACIILSKEPTAVGITFGNSSNLAHSLFSLIANPENKNRDYLYRVVELVAMNIVASDMDYADRLIDSINYAKSEADK